jgi:DNA-binding NarL/FixJ family response regulator
MRIRAVVVDDFPLLCTAVADALARDPAIEVIGRAHDGARALDLAQELQPDVIVLDLRMPELCGLAVLERLPAVAPATRAIVLTATRRTDRLLDALRAGAAGYLIKSATAEELRQAVITVHGGGVAVDPSMAGEVVTAYREAATGVRRGSDDVLSRREHDVVRLVALGHTDAEVGAALFLSRRTVQNHLARIREKTGLRRRTEIARWASERGWA